MEEASSHIHSRWPLVVARREQYHWGRPDHTDSWSDSPAEGSPCPVARNWQGSESHDDHSEWPGGVALGTSIEIRRRHDCFAKWRAETVPQSKTEKRQQNRDQDQATGRRHIALERFLFRSLRGIQIDRPFPPHAAAGHPSAWDICIRSTCNMQALSIAIL